ncbi:unnamed protein product [Symbiodinium necroappetens]|uniref:Uncharacterized protein n=1 Tax=Symbiodinium necroappetens TaxID=1628268 RepID=A0A812QTY6_9DINO|nr:unnamed protein product [Symbiodinium necroappetens]
MVRLVNLVLLPVFLYLGWHCRSELESNIPLVWHDAHASNLLQIVMFYVIVVFYLFPLLLHGSVEELAESLLINVGGYFAVYLPLMDNQIFFPTLLITVYAVMASTLVVMAGGVQLTAGIRQQLILEPILFILFRYILVKLDWATPLQTMLEASPRRRRESSSLPQFERLIDITSSREGRRSLRKVLGMYRLRQDKKEMLIAQFIWMYHAMTTRQLPRNALQAIFQFLDSAESTFADDSSSIASPVGVSSIGGGISAATSAMSSVGFLRQRICDAIYRMD